MISYGFIPKWIFLNIPLLNNVHHLDDVFATLAITPIIIFSGLMIPSLIKCDLSKILPVFLLVILYLILLAFDYFNFIFPKHIILYFIYVFISLFCFVFFIFILQNYFLFKKYQILILLLCFSVLFFIRNIQLPHINKFFTQFVYTPSLRANLTPSVEILNKWKLFNSINPYRGIGIAGTMFSGYSSIYGVESIDGVDALYPKYFRLLTDTLNLPYVWGWRLDFNEINIVKNLNSLRFLNVKYIFTQSKLSNFDEPLFQGDGLFIYSISSSWPKAFYNKCPDIVNDDEVLKTVVDKINTDTYIPFVVIPKSEAHDFILNNDCVNSKITEASDYFLTSNTTSFKIKTDGPGLIYLSENFEDDNYIAYLDSSEKKIIRSNYAFKSIYVDSAGIYNVRFEYRPRYLSTLLLVSIFTFILFVLFLLFLLFKYKKNNFK
jgi:hypothetical protein